MRYEIGDLVIFWHEHDGTNQVGLVTNRKTKKGVTTYDLRSEKGAGIVIATVNNAKSTYSINTKLTAIFQANAGKNNMFVDKNLGHTVANYAEDIQLTDDYPINHFERNNDFVFKTIGPRSY